MNGMMSEEDIVLLDVLTDALKGIYIGKKDKRRNWSQVFMKASKHQVLSLLYNRMEVELTAKENQHWLSKVRSIVWQNYHLLFTAKYVVELLEKNEIACVLLKGATIGVLFSVPELRKSGDVDILLLDKKQKKQAEALLLKNGFKKSNEQHASHHTVWFSPENIEVEIHTRLVELFNHDGANKKMEEQFVDIPNQVQRKEIMGVNFPVLRDGFQAYHLLLHMLVHYMHSGFGLRLLCDWVVFWNRDVAIEEKKLYQRLVAECGLQKFSEMITSVCIQCLGLNNPELGKCVSKEEAELFLKDVFEAEDFGTSDANRMVVLQGTGWWEYVREFHHQMRMNYPKWGKVWILWPVLWICTLVRFVKNNHNLRNTTSWRILKKTHERSRRIKELQLFQTK